MSLRGNALHDVIAPLAKILAPKNTHDTVTAMVISSIGVLCSRDHLKAVAIVLHKATAARPNRIARLSESFKWVVMGLYTVFSGLH